MSSKEIFTGPKGGQYYIKSNRKVYLTQKSPRKSPTKSPTNSPRKSPARSLKLSERVSYSPRSPNASLGRGGATKGWKEDSPRRGKERERLAEKCGDECFLLPESLKFPICSKLGINKDCKVDSRGLVAAKIRAKQHGYQKVYKDADRLLSINK